MSCNVLIAAGASGIGKAMAKAYEVNGDNVWIADSNKEQLYNCPKKWKKSHTDARDERALKKLFENIKNDWGTIDILCANAGIKGPTALIEDISLTKWKERMYRS